MRKFNYVCSLILAVMLPLMIVILSSNLVLRVSEIYVFHFNDSQVINEIPYNVTGSQMAKEISSYWSSFSGEAFQVEEDVYKRQKKDIQLKKVIDLLYDNAEVTVVEKKAEEAEENEEAEA